MKVTITGATGLIGAALTRRLVERGDEVTVLSRAPERAEARFKVSAVAWDVRTEPAPVGALQGRDAVVHLAGEPVAQRWTAAAKARIRESREIGTAHLVAGLEAVSPEERPATLVASSAVGYYGDRGDAELTEDAAPGAGFLAEVCVAWEAQADAATRLGVRVVRIRTGVVLDASGGALRALLPIFKLGLGGPVGGGRQYVPWISLDDLVGLYLAALDDSSWTGPYNGTAPAPVTNREFAAALGRALHRPAVLPVPGAAVRAVVGEMAGIVLDGQRAVPARALASGHAFAHPDLDEALRAALRR